MLLVPQLLEPGGCFVLRFHCISFELHYHYRSLSRGRERFPPPARYLYRSFLQYPEYLDDPILRLSYYDIDRVPN